MLYQWPHCVQAIITQKNYFTSEKFQYSRNILCYSQGAKGLKWRFFDHESEQAEFGL